MKNKITVVELQDVLYDLVWQICNKKQLKQLIKWIEEKPVLDFTEKEFIISIDEHYEVNQSKDPFIFDFFIDTYRVLISKIYGGYVVCHAMEERLKDIRKRIDNNPL